MKNPYRDPDENPLPDAAIETHDHMWKQIRHLRIRTALTDERVLFIMRWMFPVTWGILLLILGSMITQ